VLSCYPYSPSAYRDVQETTLEYYRVLRRAGFDVEGFCLTLEPPGPRLTFAELDARWRRRDPALLHLYERLERSLEGRDVLINGAGINLHPEFVEALRVFTVFQCFDDPESSANLSRPVAAAYDLCLVGNVAELDAYRQWGARDVEWTPLGLLPGLYDPSLTAEAILSGERDIDLILLADRTSAPRRERLDRLAGAFPDAHFYGRGWPRGVLPAGDELRYLARAKVGPNLHNSTGPVNVRTFTLPANGVLEVCDNKRHLAGLFVPGREVAGFDTVDECIDLCRYYLEHDRERREMAAAGWARARRDYSETAVFGRTSALIADRVRARTPQAAEATPQPFAPFRSPSHARTRHDREHSGTSVIGSARRGLSRLLRSRSSAARGRGSWPGRLAVAAEMLGRCGRQAGSTVADFGASGEPLAARLQPGWIYTPYDRIAHTPRTIVWDFEEGPPPGQWDVVACLGLLEYLRDPLALLCALSGRCRWLLFSYNGPTTLERRRRHGWRNEVEFAAIEARLEERGWALAEASPLANNERVLLYSRADAGPVAAA
jgi:hypothetical protein